MELTDIRHIAESETKSFKPDLIIAASGYESRSISVSSDFDYHNASKAVISYTESRKELSRINNDRFYKKEGFKSFLTSGAESPDFNAIFSDVVSKENLKVLIDISVMTRIWYHSLLKFLSNYQKNSTVTIRVAYCAALFNEPRSIKKKVSLNNFMEKDAKRLNEKSTKKTALIMGLGVEKGVSIQINNQLKPDSTFLLYADPSIQKKYVENVFISNHELISEIDIKHLQAYPLNNTQLIYNLLIDIVLPLRKDHKIMIVPHGPKIFSLIAMIFQMGYPDIDLFYPQYKITKIKDRQSSGNYTAIDLEFDEE